MLIKVKVYPVSKEQKIIKKIRTYPTAEPCFLRKSEDSFEIFVKAKPVMGQANREVVEVLAQHYNIPENKIRLIKGFKERNKIFEILNN